MWPDSAPQVGRTPVPRAHTNLTQTTSCLAPPPSLPPSHPSQLPKASSSLVGQPSTRDSLLPATPRARTKASAAELNLRGGRLLGAGVPAAPTELDPCSRCQLEADGARDGPHLRRLWGAKQTDPAPLRDAPGNQVQRPLSPFGVCLELPPFSPMGTVWGGGGDTGQFHPQHTSQHTRVAGRQKRKTKVQNPGLQRPRRL